MNVKKQQLINYWNKDTTRLFKCIKPTKTLTIGKKYEGFITSRFVNGYGNFVKFFHVINDKNQHIAVDPSRFVLIK